MGNEVPRSQRARRAAEAALVRVVHHYGTRPEFVLLGGLVPELLCGGSAFQHAGTTDVDVQVNLEVACGAINAKRLENALLNAGFSPDAERIWRWQAEGFPTRTVVKFELLVDLDDQQAGATVNFDKCNKLGAVNLRGTGLANLDFSTQQITARIGGVDYLVEVNITGLAGFLLAKVAAARSRRMPKDWYDIAFVLLHNDEGGPKAAATRVVSQIKRGNCGSIRTALNDLYANFETVNGQGPKAYAAQLTEDHPEIDSLESKADAVAAVSEFCTTIFNSTNP